MKLSSLSKETETYLTEKASLMGVTPQRLASSILNSFCRKEIPLESLTLREIQDMEPSRERTLMMSHFFTS